MSPPHLLRPAGRPRQGRLMALIAAPALIASLLSMPSTSAAANQDTDISATVADALIPAPGDTEPVAVTLITGDTVLWSDAGDDNAGVVEIEQAPRAVPVKFDQAGTSEDFYVIPSDVIEHVVAGTLDRELFNVPSLIRQGLDDRSTDGELPVIVTFDDKSQQQRSAPDTDMLARKADALPASASPVAVQRINGAGVTIDRRQAAVFREAVLETPGNRPGANTNSQSESLDGAVDKIMLDRMLEIDLAESVPQIGVPEAWQAGYTGDGVTVAVLDTGVDMTHPDLAGQVVAAENFTNQPDASDTHGHGTHVASTIAGTGVASDGTLTGVAPGADLLSGKVCFPNEDGDGVCPTSAIMAGMEWATAQGADIVNMSLGGLPTDGTDPLSELLNQLSADTGTLFVTSAGNSGCCQHVGSPAAADAALAVGAVDKSDALPTFSSKGPRLGDHAVKPEITAPGVGIVAARADDTSLGKPVDDNYTSVNGTSMASPHVAGAAALLAQARPNLSGAALKDALVSTATDIGYLWWETGTGRVEVPVALDSPVYAQGTVSLGQVANDRVEQEITYTNHSDREITLALDVTVTDDSGQALDVATLSTDTLTVPADGEATTTLMVDTTGVTNRENLFGGGIVTASAEGVRLRTAIGFGPIRHRLDIEILDSHGDRVGSDIAPDVVGDVIHDSYDPDRPVGTPDYAFRTNSGIATKYVPSGTYTIITTAPDDVRQNVLIELEFDVNSDTTVTLDARDAVLAEVTVPRKVEPRNRHSAVIRERPQFGTTYTLHAGLGGRHPIAVTPTPPGESGFLALWLPWTLAEPQTLHQHPFAGINCSANPIGCYSAAPSYIYNLPFLYENGVPRDLREKVTRADLVAVPTRYHADHPDVLIARQYDVHPPFSASGVGGGQPYRLWIQPGDVIEYFLADGRMTWFRGVFPHLSRSTLFGQRSSDRFLTAEAGSRRAKEHWFEGPLRLGMVDNREEFLGNPGRGDGLAWAAAASRGGDGNQFVPGYYAMDSTRGHMMIPAHVGLAEFASWRMWSLDDNDTELDPIARTAVGAPVFQLADEQAMYRLEQTQAQPADLVGELLQSGPVTTTWTFTSQPWNAKVPAGYSCPILPGDLCQIQPLIQLEYDLGLGINNRARAGRAHRFYVNAGHHSKAVDRAEVVDLSVEMSFDDGDTWTEAKVVGKPNDSLDTGGFLPSAEPYQEFMVVGKIPPLHRTNGYVSLRVRAADASGGTVEQIIQRAYTLK